MPGDGKRDEEAKSDKGDTCAKKLQKKKEEEEETKSVQY